MCLTCSLYLSCRRGQKNRHTVDLRQGSCSCSFWLENRIPCMHVVYCVDKKKARDTPAKWLAFRSKWIPEYFWSENYIAAYDKITLTVPHICYDPKVRVTKGKRVVLPPPQETTTKNARNTKVSMGRAGKRSRAIWDANSYARRINARLKTTGVTNTFVNITDETIFQRQPQGTSCLVV